ncbi:hypothetical protein [Amycolatopsis sp. FU40]|uniref:hypothetical protein n=1 Tax=Amycolatopsis sp. FU40 TaxID=2914159 RepID=UPI001F23EFDE|nr:hypothetical protein [Amycolatopsis sp. FU40]
MRSDDPQAAKDLVAIDDLRDREVAVDFAAANPVGDPQAPCFRPCRATDRFL